MGGMGLLMKYFGHDLSLCLVLVDKLVGQDA
jgi:hypothetical protein